MVGILLVETSFWKLMSISEDWNGRRTGWHIRESAPHAKETRNAKNGGDKAKSDIDRHVHSAVESIMWWKGDKRERVIN
jgi:hypothetical protein